MMGGMPMPQPQGGMMNNGAPMGAGTNGMPTNGGMPNGMPQAQPMPMGGGQPMPAPAPAMAGAPVPPPMPAQKKNSVSEIVLLVVVCLIAAVAIVAAVYFFMQWNDLNNNFESRVAQERSEAEAAQMKADEERFQEERKSPYSPFSGPDDYGAIYFEYPKTWDVYVSKDGTKGDYEAYFAAGSVPSVTDTENSRYALRFLIKNQSLDTVQRQYDTLVNNGQLSARNYTVGSISGTLFTGMITKSINGQVFLAKINDKTLVMQTDSTAHFETDFANVLSKLRRGGN